jgi:hypothetical protein
MSEDLLFYAQLGYADHITRLVAEGIDPDWRREDGVTTLMIASLTGRVEIICALVESGASIDLQAPDGMTALLAATAFARTTRDIAGIELLLSLGANPNLANAEGNDALMMTARHGLVEAVIVLLQYGADPKHKNRFGTTALMQAARGHLVETVRVLLRAGADRTAVDESGNELPAELDPDERHDALNRRIKEHKAALETESGAPCRFSEVRFAEARDAIQARFNGAAEGDTLFAAVCVYAAPSKFVTLTYKDFRPNLGEEARGRQASESVASFRVK